MGWAKIGTGATLAAIGGLAARYAVQRKRLERSWLGAVGPKLSSIGEVEHLSILPLVERLVPGAELDGEPGVCYLVRADGTTLLFDAGFNQRHRAESALVRNAATLGVDLQSLDGIVISHLHPDHVGGPLNVFRRTFSLSKAALEPKGLPGYVPAPMRHERAEVVLTTGPRVIAPGIAVLPPLPRMLFWVLAHLVNAEMRSSFVGHHISATFDLRAGTGVPDAGIPARWGGGVVKAAARRVERSESLDDVEHSSTLIM